MPILVIAEHDNKTVKKATLNALAAAQKLGADIDVLVAGHQCGDAAKAASQAAGVKKVLHADAPHLADFLAENIALVVMGISKNYSHILAPSTSNGKNVLPRVAALLDVQQISDIVAVESADDLCGQRARHGAIEGSDQGHHRAHHGIRCRVCLGGGFFSRIPYPAGR
jgi:electron transfer flavoprotein alpha subunit